MEQQQKLLKDYSDREKGAYLGAIASIATADKKASEEELEHISTLCDAAELSDHQKQLVLQAATSISEAELQQCLDELKGSELRFSLVTDLIAFAEADGNYTPDEKSNIEKIAQYLNINGEQLSLLDQFVKKAHAEKITPEQAQQPQFLNDQGLGSKMQAAGINTGSLMRTVLGVAGPLLLAGMFRRRMGGGMFGGGLMGGGLMGGMLGGGMLGGGIGSVIGMLGGGRRFGSTGGLLGRMLGGRRF